MIKLLFVLAVLSAGTWAAYNIIPVYNTEWKVQDAFDAVASHLSDQSAKAIRAKLPGIFHVEYIAHDDLPAEFYDHLQINADGSRVKISSSYHATVWLLGPIEGMGADHLTGMDQLRNKARLDYDFEPYAETP